MKTKVMISLFSLACLATSCDLYDEVFNTGEEVSFVAEITENSDYHFLAFAGSDGSFLEVKQENGLPLAAIFKPSKKQDPYPVWFGTDGLPEMLVVQKYVLVFDNFTPVCFDMAMVNPLGGINILREVAIPEKYRNSGLLKTVKTAGALREAGFLLAAITGSAAIPGNYPSTETGYKLTKEEAGVLKSLGIESAAIRLAMEFTGDDNLPLLSSIPEGSVRHFTGLFGPSSANAYKCLLNITGSTLAAAGKTTAENQEKLRLCHGVLQGGSGDIQVTMTWDTPSDIDLYVQDPPGEWVWFKNKNSSSGGRLDIDDMNGYGPENIYWGKSKVPAGTFRVVIENFAGVPTNYYILVQAFGNIKQYEGTIQQKQEITISEFSR